MYVSPMAELSYNCCIMSRTLKNNIQNTSMDKHMISTDRFNENNMYDQFFKKIIDRLGHSTLNIHNSAEIAGIIYAIINPHIRTRTPFYMNALKRAFIADLRMFEFMYEFLPKDILVGVLNAIDIDSAVQIVRISRSAIYIYDEINPLLYVVRYFADQNELSFIKDAHCYEFDWSTVPEGETLHFVNECKKYLTDNEIDKLEDILCIK